MLLGFEGKEGINAVAAWDKADTVVTGIVAVQVIPTMSAINAGKILHLLTKTMAARPIVIPALKKIIMGFYLLIQNTLPSFNVYKDYPIVKMRFSTGEMPKDAKSHTFSFCWCFQRLGR